MWLLTFEVSMMIWFNQVRENKQQREVLCVCWLLGEWQDEEGKELCSLLGIGERSPQSRAGSQLHWFRCLLNSLLSKINGFVFDLGVRCFQEEMKRSSNLMQLYIKKKKCVPALLHLPRMAYSVKLPMVCLWIAKGSWCSRVLGGEGDFLKHNQSSCGLW